MAQDKDQHLQGELQIALMHRLWTGGPATVEGVRETLPPRFRQSAYTTIQTVLNRLADRRLVERERLGKAFRYSARVTESEYYSQSLRSALEPASDEARLAVLAQLVGELDPADAGEIEALAEEVRRRRSK